MTATHLSQARIIQLFKAGLVAALLGVVGRIDAITGYEISAFPLYALPIGLAVLFFGARAGFAAACAATLVWMWADAAAGHAYTKSWILYLNAGARLTFFLVVVPAAGHAIANLRRAWAQGQSFPRTLPVCADCGKVRDQDGYWQDIGGYLRRIGDANVRPKLCPDCARKAYAAAGEPPTSIAP